ncbi:MAG: hypothetical protein PHI28_01285 [Mangrovibacterium sp.]|nr:hypothetical protein [Mangrovibacterium sp.]
MRKPANLIYGVDDKPPFMMSLMMGTQHVCLMFITMILPVVIVRQLSGTITPQEARSFMSISMFSGGLVTILQA